ncbi:MAG: hypothetical protein JWN17_2927 [Frankiales bacterium]|nr:hypothetical protein [Frankiales bacterium]
MTDPFDRLASFGEDGPVPPLAPPADVRARGAQRRTRTRAAVGGGVAVVVLLAGGGAYVALSRPSGTEALGVADGRGTTGLVPSSEVPEPDGPASPSVQPGGRCVGVAGGACAAPEPSGDTRGRPSASPSPLATPSVAAGVLTVQDAQAAEPGAWTRTGAGDGHPLLDPCPGGTRYPRDTARTATGSIVLQARREAGGTDALQQVARYPSPAVARDAAAGYVRAVRGCPTSTDEGTTVTYAAVGSTTVGGAATTYVRRAVTDAMVPGAVEYYAVQQLGDVVSVVVVGHGEDGDPGREVVEPFARQVARLLQRTVTG